METLRETRLPATGMIGFDATLRRMASDREAVKLGLVHLGLSLVWITVAMLVIGWFLEAGNSLKLMGAIAHFVTSSVIDGFDFVVMSRMTVVEALTVVTLTCGVVCVASWVLVTQTLTNIMKTIFCAYRGYELAERKVAR